MANDLASQVLERGLGNIRVEDVIHARVVVRRRQSRRHAPAVLGMLEDDEWTEGGFITLKETSRDVVACFPRCTLLPRPLAG